VCASGLDVDITLGISIGISPFLFCKNLY